MVVVLIPPAIDPGEPPINIKNIIIKRVLPLNAPISILLKPAVLHEIEWNSDDIIFFEVEKFWSVWLHSSIKKTRVPKIIRTPVTIRTIFV